MSKAQKLVTWALKILQRRSSPESLNDQKTLAELHTLFEKSEPDHGQGTASTRVQQTRGILQQHRDFILNDAQAVAKISQILEPSEAPALPGKRKS